MSKHSAWRLQRAWWDGAIRRYCFMAFLATVCLQVSLSTAQMLETRNTNAIGWGYNGFGQLGRGYESFAGGADFATTLWPNSLSDSGSMPYNGYSSISVGVDHVVAIEKSTQRAYSWGSNQNHQLGASYLAGDAADQLKNRNYPTMMRKHNGTPMTAHLVAAGKNSSYVVDLEGSFWATSVGIPYGVMIEVSTVADALSSPISGIVCDGLICAVWSPSDIYCFSRTIDGDFHDEGCHLSAPTLSGIKKVALISEGPSDWTLLLMNGNNQVWIGFSSNDHHQTALGAVGCAADEIWCQIETSPMTPVSLHFCSPNITAMLLNNGDVNISRVTSPSTSENFLLNSQFTGPLISDLVCVGSSLFAVHQQSETTVVLAFDFLDASKENPVILGRPQFAGENAPQAFSDFPFKRWQVDIPYEIGFLAGRSALTFANISAHALNIFALADPSLISPKEVTYRAVTWGVGDVGQLMTKTSPFSSFKPHPVSFPWSDEFRLSPTTPCSISGSSDTMAFNCEGVYAGLYGALVSGSVYGTKTRFHPTITDNNDPVYMTSATSDGIVTIRDGSWILGMSVTNPGIVINDEVTANGWRPMPGIVAVALKCGSHNCAMIDDSGFVFLFGKNASLASFPVESSTLYNYLGPGINLYNTTMQTSAEHSVVIGLSFVAINTTDGKVHRIFLDWSDSSMDGTNVIKLSAGDYQLLVINRAPGSNLVEYIGRNTVHIPIEDAIDIAAVGRTNFALAPVIGEFSTELAVHSWISESSYNRPSELLGYLSPAVFWVLTTPGIVRMPIPGMVPIALCQHCQGSTMAVLIAPFVSTATPLLRDISENSITEQSASLAGRNSMHSEAQSALQLPQFDADRNELIRTCFGSNQRGACETGASVSTSQLAFLPSSFSARKWRIMAKRIDGTCFGVGIYNDTFVWARKEADQIWPYNNLGLPQNDPWLQYSSDNGQLLSIGTGALAVPSHVADGVAFLGLTNVLGYIIFESDRQVLHSFSGLPTSTSIVPGQITQPVLKMITHPGREQLFLQHPNGYSYLSGGNLEYTPWDKPADDLVLGLEFAVWFTKDSNNATFQSRTASLAVPNVVGLASSGGNYHMLFILATTGMVQVVSINNDRNQMGDISYTTHPGPILSITHTFQNQLVSQVVATDDTSFVLLENGKVFVWGWNGPNNIFGFPYSLMRSEGIVAAPWNDLLPVSQYGPRINKIIALGDTIHLEWSSRVPPEPECPQPPPFELSTNPICGPDGLWIIIGNVNTPSGDILLTSPVVIEGNVTIPASTTIQIPLGSLSGSGSFLKINGCASIDGSINVTLNAEDLELIEQQGGSIDVSLIEAKCGIVNGKVNAVGPKSCKKVSSSQTTSNDSEGGYTLGATFRVNSNGCRLWWIVLVSVVGGLIVLAVVVILLTTLTPLKHIIRPHAKRAEEANIYHFQDKKE